MSGKIGPILVILIIAAAGLSLGFALNVPTTATFSLPAVPAHPAHYHNVTLYADANGWNYNVKGYTTNPTIVILPGTVVNFTVIEEDNQPHTLTIAYGPHESSFSDTLLSTSAITTTPGHVSHAQAYFNKTGEYTYWCIIHFTTMVGQLWVNNSLPTFSLPAAPSNMSATQNTTLFADSNGWNYSHGVANPSLYFEKGSLVNFTIVQEDGNPHSLFIAPGSNESSFSEELMKSSDLGNKTGSTFSFLAYFNSTGEYTYWDSHNPNTTMGHIYVVTSRLSIGLVATSGGISYNGHFNNSILVKNNTALTIAVSDPTGSVYNVNMSEGYVPAAGSMTVIGKNNSSSSATLLLNSPQAYALFDGFNNSTHHLLFVYDKIVNYTMNETIHGWYNKTLNPTISVAAGDLVNFTILNGDNLSHTLEINPGNNESASSAYSVAGVVPGQNSSSGFYLFNQTGNYTYWDLYHPSTAVGIITSGNASSSSAAVQPSISSLSNIDNLSIPELASVKNDS